MREASECECLPHIQYLDTIDFVLEEGIFRRIGWGTVGRSQWLIDVKKEKRERGGVIRNKI